jgi:hypothetical protein
MAFSLCWMATSFLHIEQVEANLPMNVGRLRTPFVGIVPVTGWSVHSGHPSEGGRPCLYFA